MRKQYFLLLPFLIVCLSLQVIAQVNLQQGLIAHYPFNGNANDVSGNENHGTIMNQVYFEDGIFDQCARLVSQGHFDGSSGGHILLPSFNFNVMNQFTIGLWVNEISLASVHGEAYIFFGDHHGLVHNVSIAHFGDFIEFGAGASRIHSSYNQSYSNNWIFYLLKFENGEFTAYINSVEKGNQSGIAINITVPVAAIGRHWWYRGNSTSTRLNAKIDEVRIYNRALNEQEIYALYTENQPPQSNAISNIIVNPRNDGSGLVDVHFNLSGAAPLYNIALQASFDGGITYTAIPAAFLNGNTGPIAPGNNKHIIWDGLGSFPNTYSLNTKLKITANPN